MTSMFNETTCIRIMKVASDLTDAAQLPPAPWFVGSWNGIVGSDEAAERTIHVCVRSGDGGLLAPCGPWTDPASKIQACFMRAAPELAAALRLIQAADSLKEARDLAEQAFSLVALTREHAEFLDLKQRAAEVDVM